MTVETLALPAHETLKRDRRYWLDRLSGLEVGGRLEPDGERGSLGHGAPAELSWAMPAGLTDALAGRTGDSPFLRYVAFCAAWTACLYRQSGESPVAIASPAAQARKANLLTVVLNPRGALDFKQWLGRVRNALLEAYEHGNYPADRLRTDLKLDENGAKKLFGTVLALDGLHPTPADRETDIHCRFRQCGAVWYGEISYEAGLYYRTTLARFLRGFSALLTDGLNRPETRLEDLAFLEDGDRHRLLFAWNDTAAAPYSKPGLSAWVNDAAVKTPDSVAMVSANRYLSYGALARVTARLALRLKRLGVGPETVVPVCLERGLTLSAALLAVVRAGAAYLPVEPELPEARTRAMVGESRAGLAIALAGAKARFPEGCLVLDPSDLFRDLWEPLAFPPVQVEADTSAYVIFTSGSTGNPKGAVVAHGAIVNRLVWMQRRFRLQANDRVLQKTPFGFDVSVWEFFWPPMAGACLVAAKPGGHRDPRYLAGLMERQAISTVHFVPSMLRLFLETGSAGRLPALKRAICSGEALTRDVVEAFFKMSHAHLENLYGPTEAAVDVSFHPCAPADGEPIPLGRPIDNLRLHVLGPDLRLFPCGSRGELCIAGMGLGRGYLHRPERSAARFVPDPFSPGPGARLYKTGDAARRRQDGALVFLGRLDFQVKLRGQRVELGEIEAALLRRPDIREAVATVRPGDGGPVLVAYFTVRPEPGPSTETLRQALLALLPDYMVPAKFVRLPAMPFGPNGKIDRKALPEPPEVRAGKPYAAPGNELERMLAGIWEQVLNLPRVGIHDPFFELGGHSLSAMKIVGLLPVEYRGGLPLRRFFDLQTVAELAAFLAEGRGSDGQFPVPVPVALPRGRDGRLPLSLAQQRIWTVERLEPGGWAYHIPAALRLTGHVAVRSLQHALARLTERHETLRTAFPERNGRAEQRVHQRMPIPLLVVDLRGLQGCGETLARLVRREVELPFDLARGPLLRTVLYRCHDHHLFSFTMHHLISDGWSHGVFIEELAAFYGTATDGRTRELPPLPFQYADFAVRQREWLRGEVLQRHLSFWRERLPAGMRPTTLPPDKPASQAYSGRGACRTWLPEPGLATALRALSRSMRVSTFTVLLAAFEALLHHHTRQEILTVGINAAGRHWPGTERLIGFFLNQLVLPIHVQDGLEFRELAARVAEVLLDAHAHQDLPFEKLVETLSPERDPGRTPLFRIKVDYQNHSWHRVDLPGLKAEPYALAHPSAHYDLLLVLVEVENHLEIAFHYNADLYEAATVDGLAAGYRSILETVTEAPATRLDALSGMLAETSRHRRIEGHAERRMANLKRLQGLKRKAASPGAF